MWPSWFWPPPTSQKIVPARLRQVFFQPHIVYLLTELILFVAQDGRGRVGCGGTGHGQDDSRQLQPTDTSPGSSALRSPTSSVWLYRALAYQWRSYSEFIASFWLLFPFILFFFFFFFTISSSFSSFLCYLFFCVFPLFFSLVFFSVSFFFFFVFSFFGFLFYSSSSPSFLPLSLYIAFFFFCFFFFFFFSSVSFLFVFAFAFVLFVSLSSPLSSSTFFFCSSSAIRSPADDCREDEWRGTCGWRRWRSSSDRRQSAAVAVTSTVAAVSRRSTAVWRCGTGRSTGLG